MKILLVGEYSRLHNSLKEGLVELGHSVFLIGSGDYFKNYPVDFKFEFRYSMGLPLFIRKIIYKLIKIDLQSLSIKKQFFSNTELFKDYDIVQLINESSFHTLPHTEAQILDYIFKHNKNVFLLSCGTDFNSVSFAFSKKLKYSILTPYFEGKVSKKTFQPILRFLEQPYQNLSHYIYQNIKGVNASDLDYHLPLKDTMKYMGMIPNPINVETLKFLELRLGNKIIIFHGINRENYFKKGSDLFEEAIRLVENKFSDEIEVITVESLPYVKYIQAYDTAHIVLDQVYAYDQGYNALEAMAKGKVVFTGAEQEWLDFYKLKEDTVAINALPDVEKIVEKLEWLILNPEKIIEISRNARAFVEKEHHYILSAKKYLEAWKITP